MKKQTLKRLIFALLLLAAGQTVFACGCQCLLDAIADPDTSLSDAMKLATAYMETCEAY